MITRPRNLPQADPYFDSVVLLAPFSGEDGDTSSTDLSSSAHTLTFNGTAALDSDIRKYGFTSCLLDGDSDYVQAPHSADWAFGSGDFTLECHVRFNALPNTETSGMCLMAHYLNTGNDRSWYFWFGTDDELKFGWSTDGTALETVQSTTTPTLSTNTWYHVAACRAGGTIRLFFNGSQVASSTGISGDTLHDSAQALDIGWLQSVGFDLRYLNGWIENVRITKGVARYTAAFTPPERAHPTVQSFGTYEGTILADDPYIYFRMNDDVPQVGPNPSGQQPATDTAGTTTTAIYASSVADGIIPNSTSILPNGEGGSGQNVVFGWAGIQDNTDFDPPSGSFAIEAWVRVDGTITNNFALMTKEAAGSQFPEYSLSILPARTPRFYMSTTNSTTNASNTTSSTVLTLGEVYHIVGVYRTTDDTPRIFINGAEDTVGSTWNFSLYNGTAALGAAGITPDSGSSYGECATQEIAIYYHDLTDAQILAHYRAGGGT